MISFIIFLITTTSINAITSSSSSSSMITTTTTTSHARKIATKRETTRTVIPTTNSIPFLIIPRGGGKKKSTKNKTSSAPQQQQHDNDADDSPEDVAAADHNANESGFLIKFVRQTIQLLFQIIVKLLSLFKTLIGTILSRRTTSSSPTTPPTTIPHALTGSFSTALSHSRSQSRLLLVFLPSPTSSPSPHDSRAALSLSSPLVSSTLDDPQRGYVLWTTSSPSERARVCRRYSFTATTTPLLFVCNRKDVLARHHCSPPPDEKSLVEWLEVLKKRFKKEYKKMKFRERERVLMEERRRGYDESKVMDDEREEREEMERVERRERMEKEKKEREEMEERRKEFLRTLPPEPSYDDDDDVVTIAWRFVTVPSIKNSQRRWRNSDPWLFIFDYLDAMYGLDRERVLLTTMDGRRSFRYEDGDDGKEVGELGLGKMCALRVTMEEKMTEEEGNDGEMIEEEEEE